MRHLPEGVLRRLVDEPAAVSDARRRHLDGCARCQDELLAARTDRDLVASALGGAGTATVGHPPATLSADAADGPAYGTAADAAPDLDRAWLRLQAAAAAGTRPAAVVVPLDPVREARRTRWRRPVVAAAAVAVLAVGSTAVAAAGGWLTVFRPQEVAPVTLQVSDLTSLPDLSAYGTMSGLRDWEPHPVADAAAATARSGVPAPEVADLPEGVTGAPTYAVLPKATATFTFSRDKAAATARSRGAELPDLPPGVAGSDLRLTGGPGVVVSWERDGGVPSLLVTRMTAPQVSSEGVPLATLQAALLSMPGLPDDLAAQLRALPADGSVLPLPVPSEVATSEAVDLDGTPATLVRLRDQVGGAVVWIEDGRLQAVAGLLSADDLLQVARGLEPR